MLKSAFVYTFVLALTSTMIASGGAHAEELTQIDQSKNVSQLLRSNAGHYWATVRDNSKLKDLANYIQEQGVINGDPHLGNFSVIPVFSKKGKQELKFLNIDFDDGGVGPFALEFARYVAVAKASSKNIKIKDIVTAYVNGLRGQKVESPATIEEAEEVTMEAYEAQRVKYVQKRVVGDKFKMIPGEIEQWNGRPNRDDIAAVIGNSVLDVAQRPMERGGSKDSLRLWVLVKDKAGKVRIIELKQYQETALAKYQEQPEMGERIANLFNIYWVKTDPRSYALVGILDVAYWMREKKVNVLEYADKAQEDEARLYLANLIGRFQGRQEQGAAYLAKIEKDPNRFKEAVKTFIKDYLGVAAGAME